MNLKVFLYFAVFLNISLYSAENKKEQNKDVKINAESIDYDSQNKHTEAEGNVFLEHEINNKIVTLKCSKLSADFDEKGTLIEAKAYENVTVEHDGSLLKATKCIHSFKKNNTVCEGDVSLTKEGNTVFSKKATIDFNNQVFTMHSENEEQISAIIKPKNKE